MKKLTLFLLLTLALLIASCSKAECKVTADCPAQKCQIPSCVQKTCVYKPQQNCCGNDIEDDIESGKPGNKCTCPQDYGSCKKTPKKEVKGKQVDAEYLSNYCNEKEECVLGVEEEKISSQNFLDTIKDSRFEASSVVNFNKPFDVSNDFFEAKITLDDKDGDLVLPLKLNKIKILYSKKSTRLEQLVAEKNLNLAINNIGDEVTVLTDFNLNYKPTDIEEEGNIKYQIDYEYQRDYRDDLLDVRSTFKGPSKPIILVRT